MKSRLEMKRNVLLFTLQPSSISSAGQTVRSRVSMGSGASRRLMVPLVTVSFIVMLAFTEMWLKPSRDGPSGVQKHDSSIQCYRQKYRTQQATIRLWLTQLLVGASGGGSVRSSGL